MLRFLGILYKIAPLNINNKLAHSSVPCLYGHETLMRTYLL